MDVYITTFITALGLTVLGIAFRAGYLRRLIIVSDFPYIHLALPFGINNFGIFIALFYRDNQDVSLQIVMSCSLLTVVLMMLLLFRPRLRRPWWITALVDAYPDQPVKFWFAAASQDIRAWRRETPTKDALLAWAADVMRETPSS